MAVAVPAPLVRLALLLWVASGCAFEVRAIRVGDGDASDTEAPVTPPDVTADRADAPDEPPLDGPSPDVDAAVTADVEDAPVGPEGSPPDGPSSDIPVMPPDAPVEAGPEVPECARPRALCGASCVDLAASAAHCGACDRACASGESCTAGTCLAAGSSRAGALCTRPDPRGGDDPAACTTAFGCFPTDTTAVCTRDCANSPSQATERSMCGGGNATCLSYGDGPDDFVECAAACSPGAASGAPGSCRAGFVCTGWWLNRADAHSDAPGCAPFCSRDADCYAGERCNQRVGVCDIPLPNPARLPDGAPCNPTIRETPPGEFEPRNTQCRGECLQVSGTPTQGICGSFVNVAERTTCPDEPEVILPDTGPDADNFGVCLFRLCRANAECRGPLVCRYDEGPDGRPELRGPTWCLYPTAAQPMGVP